MINKLLQRQVDKYLKAGQSIPEDLKRFLKAISDSYDQYEKDRRMLERSIELTSLEMIELNKKLQDESEENARKVFEKLKESLVLLNEDNDELIPVDADPYKLLQIAEVLKTETKKRREAEDKQAHRQLHLQSSQRIAKVGSWELKIDAEERIPTYISDETFQIFGIDPSSPPSSGNIFSDAVHPEDREKVTEAFSKALMSKLPFSVRHRVLLSNGEERIVRQLAEIVYDEKTGEPIRAIGTTQDITDKVNTTLELEKANNEILTLFENMQEVFYSVDMQTYQLIQISNACQEVYGYSREEFFENSNLWYDLILDEDKHIVQGNYPVMHAGLPFTQAYRVRHKNGEVRWLESRMRPILDENGKLIRLYGVTQDVTKREEYELALKTSNDELKKSNKELDRFVYSVSHDLRAPLSSMLGLVDISEPLLDNSVLQKNIGLIKKSIIKLDGFIHDILDYSRNSRLEVLSQKIDFNEMLHDITENLRFMSSNQDVQILIDVNEPVPFCSDKNRVSIILNNLVANAIRYCNPKISDPFVKVKIDVSDAQAQIRVLDNGIGISTENCQKIFEMFYRVSQKSAGSGLGLYIVKETINRLHGSIEVQSELNKGTEFIISLPNLLTS